MTPDAAREAFLYNGWANHRLLDAVAVLPAEELRRDLGSSFPSLWDTFVHLLSSEWLFLRRWQGTSPPRRPSTEEVPDVPALRARFTEVEREQTRFLWSLETAALVAPFRYVNIHGEPWEYLLGQSILQVLLHSAYHRGQVVTHLRQLGGVPPETDLLTWYDLGQPPATPGEAEVQGTP